MTKKSGGKKSKGTSKKNVKEGKCSSSIFLAFIATFLSIVGFLIVFIVGRNDKYAGYYAKQSLVIFIIAVASAVLQKVLAYVPILGGVINVALTILVVVIWIISWMFALTGEQKRILIVSDYADKINL